MPEPLEVHPLLPVAERPYCTHQVFEHVLSAAQCDRVLALSSALAVHDGDLIADDGDDVHDDRYRRSRLSWLPHADDTAWLFGRLAALAQRANRLWRFDLTGFTEDLQVTRYDEPGAFYTWHQDGLDGSVAGRKISVVVQLSDPADYDGAALEMLEVAEDLDEDERAGWYAASQGRGTAIAFPSFEYHRVTPLRSGSRTSLVCWVGGPPFR